MPEIPYTADDRFSDTCFALGCNMADGVPESVEFVMGCTTKGVVDEVPNTAYGVDDFIERWLDQLRF
jgi:hypothetical protein